MRYRTKFSAAPLSRGGDMTLLPFFQMAADRRLGFLEVQNCNRSHPSEG